MSTLDEINEDWQANGLSPTWAKLQRAKQEQAALIAERDALKAELERIKALEPVMVYHGACTIDCGEHGHHDTEMLKMIPAGTKLYALGSKT